MARHGVTDFLRAFENDRSIFFDNETDFLIVLDEVGRIADVNPAFERLLERDRAQIMYNEIMKFINENDLARFIHAFDLSVPREPIRFLKFGAGEVKAVLINYVFKRNEESKLYGYLILRPEVQA